MRLGFTGTREGLTEQQKDALRQVFLRLRPTEFHQGCCVGGDEQATELLRDLSYAEDLLLIRTVAYPCTLWGLVSKKAWELSTEVRFPEETLKRNRDIVDAVGHLVACPKGPEEQRSGTWSTVRYARKQKKPITVIWPDGTLTEENQ